MPDAVLLLKAATKYLEDELMPTLVDYHRFKTRVTINVLNTLRRELELRKAQADAESKRLAALLGQERELEEMSRELAERIRTGKVSIDDPALRAHVRKSLFDALSISNPKWLDR